MNKEKDDFFLHSNEVNYINREDYEKIELLVNAAKAFARSTYQCVYIIDYFRLYRYCPWMRGMAAS